MIQNINIFTIITIIILLSILNNNYEILYRSIDICSLFIDKQLYYQELSTLYIITGNSSYLNKFNNIIKISNGELPWKELNYKIASQNLVKELNLNSEENELYEKIELQQKDMLWTEIQSINWSQGLFDKDDIGKKEFYSKKYEDNFVVFTDKLTEDKTKALQNLLTPDKVELSKSLDENLRKFRDIVVNRNYMKNLYLKNILKFILLIFLSVNILNFTKINGKSDWFPILKTMTLIFSFIIFYLGFSSIDSKEARYNSYVISRIIKTIRSRLTFCVRKYVLTGDKKYFDEYWRIVNVQNGLEPWGSLNKLKSSIDLEAKDSLENLYTILSGFTDSEIGILKQAQNDSDTLIWNDVEAFNWKNGNWDVDNDGKNAFNNLDVKQFVKFTGTAGKEGSPSNMSQMASDIVYSDEYISFEDRIKQYLNKAIININKRISTSEILLNKVFIIFLVFYIISFVTTRSILIKQK